MKDATYIDKDGKEKQYYMGCYGIGIGRTLATVVEIHHDEKGIVWPKYITPYQVHLIGLNLSDEEIQKQAVQVYEELEAAGIDVLYDDRVESSPGEKFADADLIGIPVRLVVSKKTDGKIEYKLRNEKTADLYSTQDTITQLTNYYQ
jgi:prolyl-tRNA synthetase